MNFGQALEALKQGEKVKRSLWGGYWFLSPHTMYRNNDTQQYEDVQPAILAKLKDTGYIVPATAYQEDLLAEDWEIIK